jgi:hypothetical protein
LVRRGDDARGVRTAVGRAVVVGVGQLVVALVGQRVGVEQRSERYE